MSLCDVLLSLSLRRDVSVRSCIEFVFEARCRSVILYRVSLQGRDASGSLLNRVRLCGEMSIGDLVSSSSSRSRCEWVMFCGCVGQTAFEDSPGDELLSPSGASVDDAEPLWFKEIQRHDDYDDGCGCRHFFFFFFKLLLTVAFMYTFSVSWLTEPVGRFFA